MQISWVSQMTHPHAHADRPLVQDGLRKPLLIADLDVDIAIIIGGFLWLLRRCLVL